MEEEEEEEEEGEEEQWRSTSWYSCSFTSPQLLWEPLLAHTPLFV